MKYGASTNPPDWRDRLEQFDAGLQLGTDIVWNKWAVRVAYKIGLVDREYFKYHLKQRAFTLSCAYYFKR